MHYSSFADLNKRITSQVLCICGVFFGQMGNSRSYVSAEGKGSFEANQLTQALK